ncbi:MAG: shikimate kinase [Eubacteriales bacterium]|nr:shikimate kinase [Eubacteriales bacterium]MDY2600762.1 shikimate kinase [Eubacteriales bacterium]
MFFQDNVLRQSLKNVYFITGTPCGGKSTVSKLLSRAKGIPLYNVDDAFPRHQSLSHRESQPAMNQTFPGADDFFGRSPEQYRDWLLQNTREQLDFVLLDLIRLSADGPVLCDGHLTLAQAERLTAPERIVFLLKEPSNLAEEYCSRPDHQDFSQFLHSASNPEQARRACSEALRSLNLPEYRAVKSSRYFWLERDDARSAEKTAALVAAHFGF